jgi:hypothetical protein
MSKARGTMINDRELVGEKRAELSDSKSRFCSLTTPSTQVPGTQHSESAKQAS